jgi:predicted dehydrogenase
MTMSPPNATDLTRRDFIRGGSVASVLGMLGAVELRAQIPQAAPAKPNSGAKVKLGVIGLGSRGRDILTALQLLPDAEIAVICDHYEKLLNRSAGNVPGAKTTADYRTILADKEIKAVLIATPSHQHKEIALAALKAGKHVYCEAPMASTIEDAKVMAIAAREAVGQVFQPGLSMRADPQRHFLLQFIRSGATGHPVMARAQWHKKQSWRQASPNPEREKEINWRLDKSLSCGLAGEIGIHQMDMMSWLLKDMPLAVTAFGGVLHWTDGREVADTAQFVFEYPGGVQGLFDVTLANSFDGDYEMLYGTDAAVMLRGTKAWMFKEVDSPLLGWEVYARKDVFYKETGIALVANATKLSQQAETAEEPPYSISALSFAMEAFVSNVNDIGFAVEDARDTFGTDDKKKLAKQLATVKTMPAATANEGFESVVVAIKANEALLNHQRVVFQKDWFSLA